MNLLDEFLDMFLPTRCALCDRSGSPVCEACLSSYSSEPFAVQRSSLTGFALADYSVVVADMIEQFKEHGQTSIFRSFSALMSQMFLVGLKAAHLQPLERLVLVPVPSRRAAALKRGFQPAREIAAPMVAELRRSGTSIGLVNALRYQREVLDQSGLNIAERSANLAGAMQSRFSLAGLAVVLIDDVCTTGATLLEAARACEAAGASVKFFCTFAETKRKLAT